MIIALKCMKYNTARTLVQYFLGGWFHCITMFISSPSNKNYVCCYPCKKFKDGVMKILKGWINNCPPQIIAPHSGGFEKIIAGAIKSGNTVLWYCVQAAIFFVFVFNANHSYISWTGGNFNNKAQSDHTIVLRWSNKVAAVNFGLAVIVFFLLLRDRILMAVQLCHLSKRTHIALLQ